MSPPSMALSSFGILLRYTVLLNSPEPVTSVYNVSLTDRNQRLEVVVQLLAISANDSFKMFPVPATVASGFD